MQYTVICRLRQCTPQQTSLRRRRHALQVEHPAGSLSYVGFDVLATSEVIESVQALEDHAEHDDRPVDCDDEEPVEIIDLVKRTEYGCQFGVRFYFSAEWALAGEAREGLMRLAVAAAEFRAAKGTWPARPEELVTAYATHIPLDPFTGTPMKGSSGM